MPLVDYGSSGDESEEDETEESTTKVEIVQKPSVPIVPSTKEVTAPKEEEEEVEEESAKDPSDDEETKSGAFKELPRPSLQSSLLSQDIPWSFLDSKNSKGKVRIYAPALPEADGEEENTTRKVIKPSKKGCGLFSLLPSPKNQFLVAPSAALKRPSQALKSPQVKKPATPKQIKRLSSEKVSSKGHFSDESDGEAEDPTDFFSLDRPDSPPVDLPPDDLKLPLIEETKSIVGPAPPPSVPAKPGLVQPTVEAGDTDNGSTTVELDAEALSRLCGGKASRRNNHDKQIEIIDVNYSSLVPDANEWLAKEFSQEQPTRSSCSSSHKKKHEPTSQQRRKHQITFLAYQAKEQELELKNQWANNRMTRKQTQAKYGF